MKLNYDAYDADNHLYEPIDAFTRHLPERYSSAIRYVDIEGRTKIAINNKISEYIPNPTFEVVARPGAWEDYHRGHQSRRNDPSGVHRQAHPLPAPPSATPKTASSCSTSRGCTPRCCSPTLASLLEERMKDDIDLTHAAISSFNRWMLDEWTFNYHDRIFPAPIITLPDPRRAIEELEWAVDNGARAVLIRPAPVPAVRGSRSMGLPEFDDFWNAVEQTGILVTCHASDSGYDTYASDWEGGRDEFLPFKPAAFRLVISHGRPIFDTIAAMICHGLFERHPNVRVACIENGSTWVGPLLSELSQTYAKMPQEFAEDPVETFRRHISVSPFYEEDVPGLIDDIGIDRVLFGSDFPHPEGLANPLDFFKEVEHESPENQRKVMSENLQELLTLRPAA